MSATEPRKVAPVPAQTPTPRFRQIADELRKRIEDGEIERGSLLPPEPALMAEFEAARGTVRDAIAVLRQDGLVHTEHGRGTVVRPELPITRQADDRYRADWAVADGLAAQQTSFTVDHNLPWDRHRLEVEVEEVESDDVTAGLLVLAAGERVVERRLVFRPKPRGRAEQMSRSWMPASLVAGTPVADPANEPWEGGSIAQLASLGVEVTEVREHVRARAPKSDEAATLVLSAGAIVFVITRQMFAGSQPVEAAEIVIPADRVELGYRIFRS